MEQFHSLLMLLGRVCIGIVFLWSAGEKLFNWNGTKEYMRGKYIPHISLLLPAAIFLQLAGGLSILLGFYARVGALLLIVFIIPSALKMHNFWTLLDGPDRITEKTHFMKDMAILGGLLFLTSMGAGHFALR